MVSCGEYIRKQEKRDKESDKKKERKNLIIMSTAMQADSDIPRVVDRFLRMEHVSNVSHVLESFDRVYSVCELALVCQVYPENESTEATLCIVSQQQGEQEQEQEYEGQEEDVYAFIDRVVDSECGTCVLWWSGECEGSSYRRMWQLLACYLVHCGWTPTQVGRFLVDVTYSTGTKEAQTAMEWAWRRRCQRRTL